MGFAMIRRIALILAAILIFTAIMIFGLHRGEFFDTALNGGTL
jgi:hypothetical protein